MMTAAVRARSLSKRYGRHDALVDVDLDVRRGQVFGYLGPNGAGKSTTIRILVGLARPTSGTAHVLGHDVVRRRRDLHRSVGYLPSDFAAYPDMTGRDYLRLLEQMRGDVARGHVDHLAERLSLDLDRRVGALSQGNRQKVGLVQAMMHRPDLLVLDEPTTGLDPIVRRELLAMLRETRAEGRTVFLSSHVLSEVEAVADTVGIVRAGRVVTVQSVELLRERAVHRTELTFAEVPPPALLASLPSLAGVREVAADGGRTVELALEGSAAELLRTVAAYGVERVHTHEIDLEQVFLSYYEEHHVGSRSDHPHDPSGPAPSADRLDDRSGAPPRGRGRVVDVGARHAGSR